MEEITDLCNGTKVLYGIIKPYTENKAFLKLFEIFHFDLQPKVFPVNGRLDVVFMLPREAGL